MFMNYRENVLNKRFFSLIHDVYFYFSNLIEIIEILFIYIYIINIRSRHRNFLLRRTSYVYYINCKRFLRVSRYYFWNLKEIDIIYYLFVLTVIRITKLGW